MQFNLSALKAYIGAALMAAQENISPAGGILRAVIDSIEASISFDIPSSIETVLATGISMAIGYIAVYFTSNDLGK